MAFNRYIPEYKSEDAILYDSLFPPKTQPSKSMREHQDSVEKVLLRNKAVPFVDRIINASKYPVRKNPDGTVSSHLMASAEVDGRFFVYPALQYIDGQWVENEDPSDALSRNNVIWFDREDDAAGFAAGSWKPFVR